MIPADSPVQRKTEVLVPASGSRLDQELVERLSRLDELHSPHEEYLAPLGSIWLEAALWVGGAAILWIAVAMCST